MKAPFNSSLKGKDFSLAVANRSAALLRLGYHPAALKDVETALDSGYPLELKYKLLERKINLMISLGIEDNLVGVKGEFLRAVESSNLTDDKKKILRDSVDTFEGYNPEFKVLKQTPRAHELTTTHPQLPCLSSKANVEFEKSKGRFVTATSPIMSGEVILIEEAGVSLSKESLHEQQCDRCVHRIALQLTPCYHCSEVVFCSEECRDLSGITAHSIIWYINNKISHIRFIEYHKYECNMAKSFQTMLSNMPDTIDVGDLVDISRLALRMITQHPLDHHKARQARHKDETGVADLRDHDVYNLVSHADRQPDVRVMWFILAACCYVRLSGTFIKIVANLKFWQVPAGIWILLC